MEKKVLGISKPIIGVVHLPALPGSPNSALSMDEIEKHSLTEAKIYANAGFDAIIIENLGDVPFYPDSVGPETIASMTSVACRIGKSVDIPIGIQVLRNDAKSGLAIAHAVGAKFIRVNILSEAMLTDVGVIQSKAYDILRYRKTIGATDVNIFADINVKHAIPIASRPIDISAEDLAFRCLANAIILTGNLTGKETDLKKIIDIRGNRNLDSVPLLVGSGVNKNNITDCLDLADGVIVASSLKTDEKTTNPLNPKRVKEFMDIVRKIRGHS